MKVYKPKPNCPVCDGKGQYQVVYYGPNGDPIHRTHNCSCALDQVWDAQRRQRRLQVP